MYRFRLILAALAVAALGAAGTILAADNTANNAGTLTENEMIFQSSNLSDLNVYNRDNTDKKLGNLDNLIMNAHTGQLLYGILDTGVGGKLIPVPWNALKLHKTVSDNNYWLTLNQTQDQLANAPTFDKDHWPDFTKSQWKQSVDNFFGVQTVARPANAGAGEMTTNQMIFQSSRLGDLNVYNQTETSKKLGNLDNLIINAHTGQLLYGILDTGVGGKKIAVPWNAFQLKKAGNENQYWLTLNKTQDQLANAPTFDKDHLPNFTDSKWQRDVDNFFGVQRTARPEQD